MSHCALSILFLGVGAEDHVLAGLATVLHSESDVLIWNRFPEVAFEWLTFLLHIRELPSTGFAGRFFFVSSVRRSKFRYITSNYWTLFTIDSLIILSLDAVI
jgi:hypothetical protein